MGVAHEGHDRCYIHGLGGVHLKQRPAAGNRLANIVIPKFIDVAVAVEVSCVTTSSAGPVPLLRDHLRATAEDFDNSPG